METHGNLRRKHGNRSIDAWLSKPEWPARAAEEGLRDALEHGAVRLQLRR